MLLLVCVAAAAKPGHDLEAPNFDGGVSIRVHYIRHGESFWNSGQAAARASGESEAAVKALGKTERFTDSPLSVKGVLQALSLRGRLFNTSAPLDSSTGDDLESLVRRAKAKQCTPPVLYTSNLRRAIDTALLGLKPLLESDEANRITIIPALQETCHYTDCNPLPPTVRVNELDSETSVLRGPLSTDVDVGSVNFTEAAEAPGYATTADERVRRILQLQGMALDATTGSADADFVRHAYISSRMESVDVDNGAMLAVYEQMYAGEKPMYEDKRRIADGVKLSEVAKSGSITTFQRTMSPIAERLSVLMSQMLPASGAFGTDRSSQPHPTPVIIAGHSRFLRELLFAFLSNKLTFASEKKFWPHWSARALHSTISHECAALATDELRLSNTGVVSFDLQICMNSKEWGVGADGTPHCDLPTITMRNCVLGAGSTVVPRTPGSAPLSILLLRAWAGLSWAWVVGGVLAAVVLVQLILVTRAVGRKKAAAGATPVQTTAAPAKGGVSPARRAPTAGKASKSPSPASKRAASPVAKRSTSPATRGSKKTK